MQGRAVDIICLDGYCGFCLEFRGDLWCASLCPTHQTLVRGSNCCLKSLKTTHKPKNYAQATITIHPSTLQNPHLLNEFCPVLASLILNVARCVASLCVANSLCVVSLYTSSHMQNLQHARQRKVPVSTACAAFRPVVSLWVDLGLYSSGHHPRP
jgi:hypothetical protein